MYLQDIDFDVPYKIKSEVIEKIMSECDCTYDQAIKKDYDVNWKQNIRRKFTLETRCITSMFSRLIGKVKTEDCSRILVNCVDEKAKDGFSSCMGVYTLEHCIDYNDFFLKSDHEKKIITFGILKDSINKILATKDWDSSIFETAFAKIVESEYNNSWTWGKKVKSPNRLYTGEVFLEHNVKDVNIHIFIRNKKAEIIERKLVITELPHEFSYARHLGKLIWTSENEVQLSNYKVDKVGSILLRKNT